MSFSGESARQQLQRNPKQSTHEIRIKVTDTNRIKMRRDMYLIPNLVRLN
jgi:hypothetical protein